MGAKFIIDRRCSVKTSLTLIGLIEAIKHRGLLRRINDLAASGAIPPCDTDARLDLVLPAENGLPGEMTIRDLMAQVDGLTAHRVTCRQCPSSPKGHVGGCIGYVPYPISEGMEFLFWLTAVKALKDELPDGLIVKARSFAERAAALKKTPFADGMRARGDVLGQRPRMFQIGPVWKRTRLTSSQVLDAFFTHGLVAGDDLRIHAGFLAAALAVARGLEPTITDDERRQALVEDVEPYAQVYELMTLALDQRIGVYIWP